MAVSVLLLRRLRSYAFCSLPLLATVLPILFLLARAIYRIPFHLLGQIPGPKLRVISHLPHAISGTRGQQPHDVRNLHREYAPDQLSFITPSSWDDIHGHAAANKFHKYGCFKVRPDAQPMLTSSGDEHARAAFAHGFSQRAINDQEPILMVNIDRLLKKQGENIKRDYKFDICEWMRFLSFDVSGDFLLNTQFECLET
ncbi:hypothetical protein BU26DRAFT_608250 [Trematosphaeria pertusa]|uniref:Uncharacterized protein n=1 Tax=Trematosphaeria pertusa TaxID=390896 RepID=A0A6A6I569_9PLEO|nr:uncharacterized protein BU26DRAFT_608250 [Trematosphaeria pertusa]KAF2244703.1 hypothetical protein BU26DRAFT_608250 [Trematosphaeria pertusa]